MTALRKHMKTFTLSALLALVPLAGASAQAVEEAAERLKAYAADQGLQIEWDSLNVEGDNATLRGARGGFDGTVVPLGDISLTGVSRDDKGYRIEKISMNSYYTADDENEASFSMFDIAMGNVLLPDEALRDNYGGFLFYETAKVQEMRLVLGGVDVFTMNDLHFEMTEPSDGEAMEFTGAAEGFTLDLSLMEDEDQRAVVQALGYEQIEGYLEMAGSWNPQDGRTALSQFDVTVAEAGTLGFSLDLGGYTPSLIASLRDLQKQIAANPDADNSAQGLAILGLLQQLSFHGAEIAFADDSLTGKVLDFVAQNQGMKPADVANQAKAVVPFALAQLNNPELTTQASQAVAAFLDDPRSLRISASPAQPVPFALIMATAMSTPAELTKSLAVSVSAND